MAAMFRAYAPPLNTADPATSTLAPAATTSGAVSGVTPPSISMSMSREPIIDLMPADLVADRPDEGLASEAGVHGHAEYEIDHVQDGLDRALGRARVEHDAGLLAERPDRLERAVDVGSRLRMDADDVGARAREGFEVGIRGSDHQVHVEDLRRVRADGPHDVGAHGDVRDEMAVHHIDMDPVASRLIDGADLLAEPGEIGGQDRRGDEERAGHGVAGSMPGYTAATGLNRRAQRLHDLRHEVDRKLRQGEEQEGRVGRRGAEGRDQEAHVALARAVAQDEAVGRREGPQQEHGAHEAADGHREGDEEEAGDPAGIADGRREHAVHGGDGEEEVHHDAEAVEGGLVPADPRLAENDAQRSGGEDGAADQEHEAADEDRRGRGARPLRRSVRRGSGEASGRERRRQEHGGDDERRLQPEQHGDGRAPT